MPFRYIRRQIKNISLAKSAGMPASLVAGLNIINSYNYLPFQCLGNYQER